MMYAVRQVRAWLDSVPVRFDRFWPYWYENNPIMEVPGSTFVGRMNPGRSWSANGPGDGVVALFDRGGYRYFYKVVQTWRIPGDDHVATPYEHDLEYERCERL